MEVFLNCSALFRQEGLSYVVNAIGVAAPTLAEQLPPLRPDPSISLGMTPQVQVPFRPQPRFPGKRDGLAAECKIRIISPLSQV